MDLDFMEPLFQYIDREVKHNQQPQVVSVSITSNIPEFVNQAIQKLRVNVNDTWNAVLIKHNVKLNPDLHCLKRGSKSDSTGVILIHEKIGDYVAQYKKKMETYKIKIAAITRADKLKIEEKLRNQAQKLQRKPPQAQRKAQNGTPAAEIRKPGTGSKRPRSNKTLAPNKRPKFPEDFMPGLPNMGAAGPSRFDNGDHSYDFDDSVSMASQDSQDSQDPGDDIKTGIVEKMLKCMTNGDMHRIRQELITLKQREKFMKVSRYIPVTLNMLQNIFVE